MILEAESDLGFKWIKLLINNQLVNQWHNLSSIQTSIPDTAVCISLEFYPFKQQPRIRINDFLLNYWVANIKLWDHRIDLELGADFYDRYQQRDLQGRISHLTSEQTAQHHYQDKYIGINNLYPELVKKIRKIINQ